jgi:hypothetical protein
MEVDCNLRKDNGGTMRIAAAILTGLILATGQLPVYADDDDHDDD